MVVATHGARITGLVRYLAAPGDPGSIPCGPCLLEQLDDGAVDIVWGARGQSSVALSVAAVEAALADGGLVLLE